MLAIGFCFGGATVLELARTALFRRRRLVNCVCERGLAGAHWRRDHIEARRELAARLCSFRVLKGAVASFEDGVADLAVECIRQLL
jgi:hypothetical protein